MQRRTVLASTGTALAGLLPGCSNVLDPAADDDGTEAAGDGAGVADDANSTDREPAGEPLFRRSVPVGETVAVEGLGDVTVESVSVQRSMIDEGPQPWRIVHEPERGQLLVLDLDVVLPDGEIIDTATDVFHAVFDGERIDRPPVGYSEPPLRYGLEVPVAEVEHAAVVLETGDEPAWRLPRSAVEDLAAAPEFHLHVATVREDDDGNTVLELTVENRGDRDGTFRARVVSSTLYDADVPVQFDVPAGETVTETVEDGYVEWWVPDAELDGEIRPDTRSFSVAPEDEVDPWEEERSGNESDGG